jgi:hypothetical protein
MFQRRKKRTILQNLKEIFWPDMGWIRASYYAKHRLLRLSSTTHKIATGLACGACISFTPFFGCHFLLALAYAWLLRGHYLAAIIGTFVGNPWTFPLLFVTSYKVGIYLLTLFGFEVGEGVNFDGSFENAESGFSEFFFNFYVPTALGGVVCMILSWPIFYIPFYLMVRSAKVARRRHLRRKWKKKWQGAAEPNAHHDPQSAENLQANIDLTEIKPQKSDEK